MSVLERLEKYKNRMKVELFNRVVEYKPLTPFGKRIKKEIIERLIKRK